MRLRAALTLCLALVATVLLACSESAPKSTCKPHGTELEIAVLASASHQFTKDCLAAPAGQPFTIYFNNQDTSAHGNHNIRIELPDDDFVGEIAFHGTDITYEVGPLQGGTYQFRCSHHPEMNGMFIVAPLSSPAGEATS
jgi:plastocyanin